MDKSKQQSFKSHHKNSYLLRNLQEKVSPLLSENIGRIQSPKIIRIGAGVAKEIVDVLKQLNLIH